MKKSRYIILLITIICVISVAIVTATGTEPGSSNDPVVSKSYVDARISELKTLISGSTNSQIGGTSSIDNSSKEKIVEEVIAIVDALYGDKFNSTNTNNTIKDPAFLPVQVLEGQKLIGGEGAEIIFRSGKANAYSENEMGVIDVSSGTELFHGANIVINHLLIVARNDGRGVYALQDSWFMVKGSYTIK